MIYNINHIIYMTHVISNMFFSYGDLSLKYKKDLFNRMYFQYLVRIYCYFLKSYFIHNQIINK